MLFTAVENSGMRISAGLKRAVPGVGGHEVQDAAGVLGADELHSDGGAVTLTVKNEGLRSPSAGQLCPWLSTSRRDGFSGAFASWSQPL